MFRLVYGFKGWEIKFSVRKKQRPVKVMGMRI